MKNKTIPFIFLIGVLSILGNIFYNPTTTTTVESNKYLTPANPAFDDDNFYQCITDKLRVSSDNNVTDEQLARITSLECNDKNIKSTKGLEKITSLEYLYLQNNQLTSIDVSNNTNLLVLNIGKTNITELDVTNNTKLTNVLIEDKYVTVIGLDRNKTNLLYAKSYIFEDYDLVATQNVTKYDLTVGNNVTKLAYCKNPTSDNLCIIANMECDVPLGFLMVFSGMTVNDKTIPQERIVQALMNSQGLDENGNYIISDLNEGQNIITSTVEGKTYTINVYRKTLEEEAEEVTQNGEPNISNNETIPNNDKKDDIIENNAKENSINQKLENIIENPETGIALSILLSLIAIILVLFTYVRYYKRKKSNI